MVPQQWRQRPQVLLVHLCPSLGLAQYALNHQRVDIDQTDLQQM